MQIKTINKRIRDTRDEIDFIIAELRIKLDRFLRTLNVNAKSTVSCSKVIIKADYILSHTDIKKIEEEFMLELLEYKVSYSPADEIIGVECYFEYVK